MHLPDSPVGVMISISITKKTPETSHPLPGYVQASGYASCATHPGIGRLAAYQANITPIAVDPIAARIMSKFDNKDLLSFCILILKR
jgi:hypothetical protein